MVDYDAKVQPLEAMQTVFLCTLSHVLLLKDLDIINVVMLSFQDVRLWEFRMEATMIRERKRIEEGANG